MRRINPNNFHVATRGTSRGINRQIALNLVRAHQPISRADLARKMGLRRGAVSLIVNDLLKDGAIVEGATGEAIRGRKPTFLYIDTHRRAVIAIDIRVSQTLLMLAERDRIIDNAKTRRFVERFRCEKQIIEYPKAHHTLEFEPDDHPFVNDLLRWMDGVIGRAR